MFVFIWPYPMPLTAEDVKNKQFTPTRFKGGYDEKEVDDFAGLPIREFCTLRPHPLPCGDGFSHNAINWFGERGSGLVDRDINTARKSGGPAGPHLP